MMRRCATVAALAVAALPSVGAAAPAGQPSVENVYWMVDCLLKRDNQDLERVLSTIPGARDSNLPWVMAAIGPCLVKDRPVPAAGFLKRGAVAERLLYRDFDAIGSSPKRRPAPVFAPVTADYLKSAEEYSLKSLSMLGMAACVVRAEPVKSYSFFRTERGGAAEEAAIKELVPAISACIREGQSFELQPEIFRAFLSEAAYRAAAGYPRIFEVAQ